MSKTHQNHYLRPAEPLDSLMSTPRQRTKQPPRGSNVILHRPNQLREEWRVSSALSSACRKGRFRQRREHDLVAILAGKTYGAAIGGHYSLIDKESLADRSVIYIFKAQGTSTCRVYHRSQ